MSKNFIYPKKYNTKNYYLKKKRCPNNHNTYTVDTSPTENINYNINRNPNFNFCNNNDNDFNIPYPHILENEELSNENINYKINRDSHYPEDDKQSNENIIFDPTKEKLYLELLHNIYNELDMIKKTNNAITNYQSNTTIHNPQCLENKLNKLRDDVIKINTEIDFIKNDLRNKSQYEKENKSQNDKDEYTANNILLSDNFRCESLLEIIDKFPRFELFEKNNSCHLFTDTEIEHHLHINDNTIVYITAVGGGGAGGCGFIDGMYYYSGGGGGSGAYLVECPINITNKANIHIKIGKGGRQDKNINGGDTIIKIIYMDGSTNDIRIGGGKNGNPLISAINAQTTNTGKNTILSMHNNPQNISTEGGYGGTSTLPIILSGNKGGSGSVSLPSQSQSTAGSGGSSLLIKGLPGTSTDKFGVDGTYGSGGGGSLPTRTINSIISDLSNKKPLSGNGGDGFVIIRKVQISKHHDYLDI